MAAAFYLAAALLAFAKIISADCPPGFGEDEDSMGLCHACSAGRYRSAVSASDACDTCPGGRVPANGACFTGTELASTIDNETGEIVHARGVRSWGGSCYFFEAQFPSYWTDAERSCKELGGHLVCLSGQTEAKWVAGTGTNLYELPEFWIGLNERGNMRAYDWTNSHCCSDYRNWYVTADGDGGTTREPKDDLETASYRCVRSDGDGHLHDDNCRAQRGFVCEAPVILAATACSACRKGSTSAAGDIECKTCEFGKYSESNGEASCASCPTLSPAALLARRFGQNGCVQCGGNLGKAQRAAYIWVAVLAAFGPFLGVAIVYTEFSIGEYLAVHGLAGGPTRDHQRRSSRAAASSMLVFVGTAISGALFATWLAPIRQGSERWPYKGRLTPSSEVKGCDPAGRYPFFVAGSCFLGLVVVGLIAVFPVVDVRELARRLSRGLLKRRLRRQFAAQRDKYFHERQEHQRILGNKQPNASFACTLCAQERASALNIPCGHTFFCIECARAFRSEHGDICNVCRKSSQIHDVLVRGGKSTFPSSLRCRSRQERRHRAAASAAESPFEPNAPIESVDIKLHGFDSTSASVKSLEAAIAATKCVRIGARRRVLASTCSGCSAVAHLVVNVPCGHVSLCAGCAAAFRAERGNVCSSCIKPSSLATVLSEQSCSVCFDVVSAEYLVALGSCGHQLCTACSVGYVRSALSNVAELVTARGVRCPLGGMASPGKSQCAGLVDRDLVQRLVAKNVRPDMADVVLPMSAEEFERLIRFIDEANIPLHERFNCCHSNCSRLFSVPHRDLLMKRGAQGAHGPQIEAIRRKTSVFVDNCRSRMTHFLGFSRSLRDPIAYHSDRACEEALDELSVVDIRGQEDTRGSSPVSFTGDPPFVMCPFCEQQSCVRCKSPAHPLLTCEEMRKGPAGQATQALVLATSKPCPQCSFRITHYHGHACHHIRPGTGCPNCGTHFCYRCLARGSGPSRCGCRLFCQNDDIRSYIQGTPYPHDTRCGCPICPDCRPQRPCPQCHGGCVVCQGAVAPGPSDANYVVSWGPELGAATPDQALPPAPPFTD